MARFNRRTFVLKGGAFSLLSIFDFQSPAIGKDDQNPDEQLFLGILKEMEQNPDLISSSRSFREISLFPPGLGLETVPIRGGSSSTEISKNAIKLIVASEVSSRITYERLYQIPVWPGGRSGVTIGIGYDLGYATKSSFLKDWELLPSKNDLEYLRTMCGVTKERAKNLAKKQRTKITKIPWSLAYQQFIQIMLPRYVGLTERNLENFGDLSPQCRGALVSLVYNRGASFKIPSSKDKNGRFKEMRAIRKLMRDREYAGIPDQIRSMKRLWDSNKLPGLHKRRDAEAALFQFGLVPY